VRSGWVSSKGAFIEEFEKEFASYTGVRCGVTVSNGTVALHLALKALGIKRGDEVLVPALTFVAVANAVLYVGAKPVFVDSNADYWCLDPLMVEKKITKKTKALICVHLYGHPCDMDPLVKLAKTYNLHLIEDCAEAHGAEYKGKKVGCFGVISCFSFYGNKIITTGEGGICLTNDETLARTMTKLRDHGMNSEKRYWHDVVGYNYRMTNLQAALGVAQLKKLDRFIAIKRQNAKLYGSLLGELPGLTLHPEMPWAKNVYWLYCILIDKNLLKIDRDALITKLSACGIETRPFFYPINHMPPYKKYAAQDNFSVAQNLSLTGINLPSSVKLTADEIYRVVDCLRP
jgi:perosamine synthetase